MFKNVSNEALVPIIDTVPGQYSSIATKCEEAVYLYSSVIPSAFLEGMTVSRKAVGISKRKNGGYGCSKSRNSKIR